MAQNDNGKDKMIDRIKKLLALSQSPNENEAAAAAEKAQALLAEYNISLSEVQTKDSKEDESIVMEGGTFTTSYPWRRPLASAVASMYFCKYFYMTHRNTASDEHYFVGAKHNAAVAKMMFTYLSDTIDRLAKEGARSVPASERSPYRTTFRAAATQRVQTRIWQRIQEAKAGQMKSSTGTNLPALADLYDQWSRKAEEHIKKEMGPLRTKASKLNVLHGKGLSDGKAAGDRIGLDQQMANERRAMLR